MNWYTLIKSVTYEKKLPDAYSVPFVLQKEKWKIATISTWPIWYLAYVDFPQWKVRANHYHEHKREHFYILWWEITFYIRHNTEWDNDVKNVELKQWDLLIIEPFYSHAFIGDREWSAIEYCEQSFEDIWNDKVRDYVISS